MAQQCRMCHSYSTLRVYDSLFCEKCNVYYSLADGDYRPTSLPLREAAQTSLRLCRSCAKKYPRSNAQILASSFADYFNALSYCRVCKVVNRDYIKNHYYKNFIQHRTQRATFGWKYWLLYALTFFAYSPGLCTRLCWLLLVEYKRSRLSCLRALVIFALFFHLGGYAFFRDAVALYVFCAILLARTVCFAIPANPQTHDNIHSLLNRLNIRDFYGASHKGPAAPAPQQAAASGALYR
ncbi:hypothetical protein PAPHI01_1858 [Pancytospora philotis]|nr:hypothetical protein PAPHI01_1858 [Pancytospora philotis]